MMRLSCRICILFLCGAMLMAGCGPAAPQPTAPPTEQTPTLPEPAATTPQEDDTLKILAIGGSFSIDAMEYLYQIMEEGGQTKLVLGNLYNGGASLGRHLKFATNDSPEYSYYKNTTGTWEVTDGYTVAQALADENWDYITMQQSSGSSGMDYTYEDSLPQLIAYVRERNPDAKLVWHMTWAYQQDYNEGAFPSYDKDQQKMYSMIVDCVQRCVLSHSEITFVIPAGTAIQNARTSFLGDTLTRDGFHLDLYIGRYIAALTWYAAITGNPVDDITYNPAPAQISEDMLAAAREAAENAVADPYNVTQSKITEGNRP